MKLGGPEGGGEGQSFVARARQQELQDLENARIAQFEYSLTPEAQEAREAQINIYISDFDRMAKTRTDEEIDQLIRASNTDVSEESVRGEAYSRWKAQRNVVDLGKYREDKAA